PNSTGIKSAHLYSRMIGNISANGNMTTGRIFAGSWTPSDLSNYNAIVPADPAFRQIIEQQPDSVAIWIKYQPANPDSEDAVARLSFILHGEHESEIVKEPSAQESKLITSQAEMNYGPTQWQRISIPFVKKNDIQPKYMLASITTNQLPGIGTGGVDHVYADDAVLIYKPVLSVETPVIANLQEGDSFELSFTLTGTMSVSNIAADANTVHAELSDHTGSFDTPVVISEPVTTDESGTLQVKLPTRMISGDQYKIRVVTTNYPMTQEAAGNLAIEGSDTGTDLKETMTSGLKVYPNPAKERLFITGADNQNYRILNIAGRVIRATATYRSVEGIDTSVLTPGIYFIEINGAKSTEILKFIKE
ncbi:MAG: T9SS type A sorting domain-containing protein, partial [Bacteroidales bacterium]